MALATILFPSFPTVRNARKRARSAALARAVPEHADLIASISFKEVRPAGVAYAGENTLELACIEVNRIEDPSHPGNIDEISDWEGLGPEGAIEMSVRVYSYHFGKTHNVEIARRAVWGFKIEAPGKPLVVIPEVTEWETLQPGWILLAFPFS